METELKFEVDAAGARALRDHLDFAGLGRSRQLRAVYYDTPETDLRDHGLTLRVRDDGEQRIQTVKRSTLNGTGLHRGEWERPLGVGPDLSPDLDAAARTPLAEVLSRREMAFVRPVFEVEVKRLTREIEIDGAIIEVALDHGCARAEGRRAAIEEIELELKAGSPKALFTLARDYARVAMLELSFVSKAERGYALAEQIEVHATGAANPTLGPDATAGQAFQAIAGSALAQIAANARVLKAAREPEVLHQLRVGVRRLRSAMSLFAPMLADGGFEAVKAELKWLAGELDAARDLDVFGQDVFAPAEARDPGLTGLAAFGRKLKAARKTAYDQAQAAVRAPRFRALMLDALAWIEAGDWCLTDDPMLTGLRRRPATALSSEEFEKRRRKIVKQGRALETMAPAERHKLRIKVKRLRYACGFFESLYDGKLAKAHKAFSAAARDLQDALGALTDIAFSRDLARRVAGLGPDADPEAAFAAGALVGQAAAPAKARLKAARKAHRVLKVVAAFW